MSVSELSYFFFIKRKIIISKSFLIIFIEDHQDSFIKRKIIIFKSFFIIFIDDHQDKFDYENIV